MLEEVRNGVDANLDGACDLGHWFVSRNLITPKGLAEAREFQSVLGGALHQAILKLGLAREADILEALSGLIECRRFPCPDVREPDTVSIETALSALRLTPDWALLNEAVIWASQLGKPERDDVMLVMARNPLDPQLIEAISRRWPGGCEMVLATNRTLDILLAGLDSAEAAIEGHETGAGDLARLRELAEEAPVIEFVNGLFAEAFERNASDIHIRPGEESFESALRVDGVLTASQTYPKVMFDSVCTRVKILSGMDIAERRLPQDGRQSIRIAGEEIDLRVSTLPSTHGESVVMRILRKKADLPDIQGLGLRGPSLHTFQSLVGLPNGVILVTGPTGSGKSTTLYRAIESLNTGQANIVTIEDPVEYEIEGVNQVQANTDIGLTFASGLRSILRQDPDVIMVGEIRDRETAIIAIQSALTGHLVFSTLHTNSALGAVERLVDLGIEPFLISASLRGVVGQRLMRQLCPTCRISDDASVYPAMALTYLKHSNPALLDEVGSQWSRPVGCAECAHSGYRGRIGVFEVVNFHALNGDKTNADLRDFSHIDTLRAQGFRSMLDDALVKASHAETSLAEVERLFGRWYDQLSER